jgi:hypothetical protein
VRRDCVDKAGRVTLTLRDNSQLHHIALGRAHTGTRALDRPCASFGLDTDERTVFLVPIPEPAP